MKKNTFAFALLLFSNQMFGQVFPWHQYADNSCWAASLAYVSSKIAIYNKNQCDIIRIKEKLPPNRICNCDIKTSTILEDSMKILTREILEGYNCHTNSSMGRYRIADQLNSRKKPIIYDYLYDGTNSHIVVMDSLEQQNYVNNGLVLIKIKDPWPQCHGNEYYITYERYYSQYKTPDTDLSIAGKYTIYWSDCNNDCTGHSISNRDKGYLDSVLFYKNNAAATVKQFLEKQDSTIRIGKNTLSNDFYKITNIPRTRINALKIGPVFNICSSGKDELRFSEDTLVTLKTILDYTFDEKIICVNSGDTVKTIVSVSNKKMRNATYSFYNNWILYHIEKGEAFDSFFRIRNELNKNFDFAVINKDALQEGLIIKKFDTSFMIFKVNSKYYVYDLYGDGFKKIKIQANKVIDFAIFNKAVLNVQQ